MIYQREIHLRTTGHEQMHDLTDEVDQIVSSSGVRIGTVNVFNVGSTGAIGAIEFEPGLQKDLPGMLDKLLPPNRGVRPRTSLARWKRSLAPTGDDARALADSPGQRWKAGPRHLAAGLSVGVRHQTRQRTIIVTVLGES